MQLYVPDSERLELLKEKILAIIKLIENNNLPKSFAYIKSRTQLELLLDAVNYDREYWCHYPRVQREDLEKVLEARKLSSNLLHPQVLALDQLQTLGR
ncbi:MAG: hypothetical protein ACFFC7_00655 [Candidatus Hermodarchaeota archaeon]